MIILGVEGARFTIGIIDGKCMLIAPFGDTDVTPLMERIAKLQEENWQNTDCVNTIVVWNENDDGIHIKLEPRT